MEEIMLKLLKRWFLSKILRRKYFTSVDYANNGDYTIIVNGYIDKNGVKHIAKIKIE